MDRWNCPSLLPSSPGPRGAGGGALGLERLHDHFVVQSGLRVQTLGPSSPSSETTHGETLGLKFPLEAKEAKPQEKGLGYSLQ